MDRLNVYDVAVMPTKNVRVLEFHFLNNEIKNKCIQIISSNFLGVSLEQHGVFLLYLNPCYYDINVILEKLWCELVLNDLTVFDGGLEIAMTEFIGGL